jgi:hypothetical protein
MKMAKNPFTTYPAVDDLLSSLLQHVRQVLGAQFTGLYLYGSLASGDFDPLRSDIDFVVTYTGELSQDTFDALETMHARLAAGESKWAAKLEGAYLPLASLRRYDPEDGPFAYYNEGRFQVGYFGNDWIIQRHVLREHGVILAGPDLRNLIDPVSPAQLKQAVRDILREWWSIHLEDPTRLRASDYQAFAILTMCRALHTLHSGEIVSKPVAARWAQQALGPRWQALIQRALDWQPGQELNSLEETVAYIHYTLENSSL